MAPPKLVVLALVALSTCIYASEDGSALQINKHRNSSISVQRLSQFSEKRIENEPRRLARRDNGYRTEQKWFNAMMNAYNDEKQLQYDYEYEQELLAEMEREEALLDILLEDFDADETESLAKTDLSAV